MTAREHIGGFRRLDEVTVFGGKLTLLIPHEWVDGDDGDEGTYLYYEPDAQSGWFRISLLTIQNVQEPEERLYSVFKQEAFETDEETGNLVLREEKDSMQDGVPLRIFKWRVGGIVLPDKVVEAIYSYTVLVEKLDKNVAAEIKLLHRLVSKSRFA